jgi:hypothetical protein
MNCLPADPGTQHLDIEALPIAHHLDASMKS